VSEVRVVSALVNGVDVAQGTPVADLVLRDKGGAVVARATLEAGRDVMEWAWSDPGVQSSVQHQHVEAAGQAREYVGGAWQNRELSYGRAVLSQPVSASTLEVRSVTPRGTFVLYGGAALGPDTGSQLFGRHKAKYREVYRDKDVVVLEDTAAFPRAFLVPSARLAPSPGAALDQMVSHAFDPRREVMLASDSSHGDMVQAGASETASAAAEGTARVDRYTPAEVQVSTDAPAPEYLVLSDSYYPGWHAYVDGQEQPIVRGDVLFRVVHVPAGTHQVTFRFDPASPKLGLAISLGTLLLLGAGLAYGLRPGRRPQPTADD
jgi:hypothetical protein